jgi:hypothetical protein
MVKGGDDMAEAKFHREREVLIGTVVVELSQKEIFSLLSGNSVREGCKIEGTGIIIHTVTKMKEPENAK